MEEVKLGPNVPEGEEVFAVAHIFASFNDTFVVCNNVHSHHQQATVRVYSPLPIFCHPTPTARD